MEPASRAELRAERTLHGEDCRASCCSAPREVPWARSSTSLRSQVFFLRFACVTPPAERGALSAWSAARTAGPPAAPRPVSCTGLVPPPRRGHKFFLAFRVRSSASRAGCNELAPPPRDDDVVVASKPVHAWRAPTSNRWIACSRCATGCRRRRSTSAQPSHAHSMPRGTVAASGHWRRRQTVNRITTGNQSPSNCFRMLRISPRARRRQREW